MFGFVFLITFAIFPVIYLIGYASFKLLYVKDLGSIGNTFKHLLFFLGVIVHELSHRVTCFITGVPAYNMRVKYRADNSSRAAPHGSVSLNQPFQITFTQALLISFSPLLIGTWIIYFLLQVVLSNSISLVFRVIAVFCILSILLTLSPSQSDLAGIKRGYQNDPQHGQYQIFLIILSFLISWAIVEIYDIIFPYEFFYYFLIIFCYIFLKYSFISSRVLLNKIKSRNGRIPSNVKRRKLIRRRFKPEMVEYYYEE
jgi:hypothetical protein